MNTPDKIKINNNLRLDSCPCCKSRDIYFIGKIKYSKNTRYSSADIILSQTPELWSCKNCNSTFTQNRVSEQDSIKLYSQGSSWQSTSFFESKSYQVISSLDTLITPSCKLLDVGCSNGTLLDYVYTKGAKTHGLEYSIENRELLISNNHIAYSNWEQINDKFNIITAFDVVEHLYNIEEFLEQCNQKLLDGGYLLILTGNINSWPAKTANSKWWYYQYPEHILFPSQKYLQTLIGYDLIKTVDVYSRDFYSKYSSTLNDTLKIMKNIVKFLWFQNFYPLPFMPKDHQLFILRKHS